MSAVTRNVRLLASTAVAAVALLALAPAADARPLRTDGAGYYFAADQVTAVKLTFTAPQVVCTPGGLLNIGLEYVTSTPRDTDWGLFANLDCQSDGISPPQQLELYDYHEIIRGYQVFAGDRMSLTYTARRTQALITVRDLTRGTSMSDTVPISPGARLFVGAYRDPRSGPSMNAPVRMTTTVDGQPLGAVPTSVQAQYAGDTRILHVSRLTSDGASFTLADN